MSRHRPPAPRSAHPTQPTTDHRRQGSTPMELTGAQALIKSLEMQQVEVMFGLPGGAILPVYDPIIDSSIRHILVRHEQGAGHMAEGYAQVTGRPGVAIVTSGPGSHQHRHPAGRRLHGLDPAGGGDRAGGHRGHRHRRLPGERHHRHHHGHHQAQLADHRRGRHPPGGGRGVPRGHHRTPRPGADRRPQGRGHQPHGVVLARAVRPRPPRLSPDDRGRSGAGARGRRAAPGRRAAGHLRRRRDPQGPRRRRPARAGRADRASRWSPP